MNDGLVLYSANMKYAKSASETPVSRTDGTELWHMESAALARRLRALRITGAA